MTITSEINLTRCLCSLIVVLTMSVKAAIPADSIVQSACPLVKLEVERLPELSIPRAGHELFCVNGELTIVGGHTNGFVPTPTAEYLKNGKWHMIQMVYSHDFGTSVVLKSGKVLLAGGCEQNIGVGQTFTAELYDPVSHTFDGFGSMERKRTMASALEIDSSRVVIAGNWYHNDGIEIFDGKKRFTYQKDATVGHSAPHLFRIAKDDVFIIGDCDIHGDTLHSTIADRLKGDAVTIPLFETWHPMFILHQNSERSFIGNESKDCYAYLMPVVDKNGQVAIAKVENGIFSLLSTTCPVPMMSQFGRISYISAVIANQKSQSAYLMGLNSESLTHPEKGYQYFVLCIDYAKDPAPLTLYYTDFLPVAIDYTPVLTDEGNLLIAGGLTKEMSNFKPSNAVYLLHVGQQTTTAKGGNSHGWIIVSIVAALLLAVLLFYLLIFRRRQHHISPETIQSETLLTEKAQEPAATESSEASRILMSRIEQLMEEEQLFLNSDLKISDFAVRLGTNSRYVSDCINLMKDCSFSQYVNGYRVEYAKNLLRNQSDQKIGSVCTLAGFANETSFFRAFKAHTGMTPKEWLQSIY